MTDVVERLSAVLAFTNDDLERMLRTAAERYADRDFGAAESILAGIVVLTKDARALQLLGATLMMQRRFDEATDVFEIAVERAPNDPYALVALGELRLRGLEYDAAVGIFEHLFEIDPDGPAGNRARYLLEEHLAQLRTETEG